MAADFEFVRHGIEHEQYFQGCGVAFTRWTNAVTGIGSTEAEAFDDALEMLAQMEDCTSELMHDAELEFSRIKDLDEELADGECHYYVSIRYGS